MNPTITKVIAGVLTLIGAATSLAPNYVAAGEPEQAVSLLKPLDYKGVELKDSALRQQRDAVLAFYMAIPNDDWLKPYRLRAGKPAPGKDLGGGYTSNWWNIFGQVVSGLARCHAASGDSAVKAKVDALVAGWLECVADDGFFFPYASKNRIMPHPHYVYEKIVCGLVDAHLYCQSPGALDGLRRITDWAQRNLEYSNPYNYNNGYGPTEWYTLSENLLRAYSAAGDQRYRKFADRWNYSEFWDLFPAGQDIFTKAADYHAYSSINSLNGAAEFYRVTGDARYLRDVQAAYDWLASEQMYVTGGWGPGEKMLPPPGPSRRLIERSTNHFETQCGVWAAMKLTKHLTRFTGESRLGNWTERLLYNGLAASLATRPDGSVFYFSSYGVDGCAKALGYKWVCCNGTLLQAWADIADQIYFRDESSLAVNQFIASTVTQSFGGQSVRVDMHTQFPRRDEIRWSIRAAQPVEFTLKWRVPDWLTVAMTATLNGQPIEPQRDALGWASVRRAWKQDDSLVVRIPFTFRVADAPGKAGEPLKAIAYGPLVLAVAKAEGAANPGEKFDFAHLAGQLISLDATRQIFTLKNEPGLKLKPFLDYRDGESYFMYLKASQR